MHHGVIEAIGLNGPTVIRTGSDIMLDDLDDTYHRVGTECPPNVTRLLRAYAAALSVGTVTTKASA